MTPVPHRRTVPAGPVVARRTVLQVGLGLGVAAALPLDARPAAAAPVRRAVPAVAVATVAVEGSGARTTLQTGAATTVLLHVARRFHYEVRPVDHAVTGYGDVAPDAPAHEAHHLTGTAIDIDPGAFPPGARDGLYPHELTVVRDVLADCEGLVWWGGDATDVPCEGHFHLVPAPDDPAVARLAQRLARSHGRPGGAGTGEDLVFTPDRLEHARAVSLDLTARTS